jgi:hypothetical protein
MILTVFSENEVRISLKGELFGFENLDKTESISLKIIITSPLMTFLEVKKEDIFK